MQSSAPLVRSLPRSTVIVTLLVACAIFGTAGVLYYRTLARQDRVEPTAAEPKIKVPQFVDPGAVVHTSRFAFSFDPPQALAELRRAERLDEVVAGADSDEEAFRRLMSWTRAQWELGRPDPYPPPDARIILAEIRAGRTGGFCAQYCVVLAQAIQSLGRPARFVTIRDHEVIEAWLADEQRWVMLDPTLRLQIEDEHGRSLSALHIHVASRQRHTVSARNGHLLEESLTSYVDRYKLFAIWLRNDLVSRPVNFLDFWRYRVWWDADPGARALPAEALRTTYPHDLYPALPRLGAQPGTR